MSVPEVSQAVSPTQRQPFGLDVHTNDAAHLNGPTAVETLEPANPTFSTQKNPLDGIFPDSLHDTRLETHQTAITPGHVSIRLGGRAILVPSGNLLFE